MPIYPVYWQLEYPGGLLRNEPPEGETILHAPRGYSALRLVDMQGSPVQRVEIPARCRPIFYRVRSKDLELIGNEAVPVGEVHLDATVFGFGQDPEYLRYLEEVNTALWIWNPRLGRALDCPKQFLVEGAIRNCLTSPIGV